MIGMMNHMETTLEIFQLVENPFDVLGQVNFAVVKILTFNHCDLKIGLFNNIYPLIASL